nr:hypothetical protein [uncultured Cetobacterium sp.]
MKSILILTFLLFFSTGNLSFSEDGIYKFKDFNGRVEYIKSETRANKIVENFIEKIYGVKKGEDLIFYYYNYIDLNDDGDEEVFVYLYGPMVSGSGGDSAFILKKTLEGYKVVNTFTVIRNPILISDGRTKGWKDLIVEVYGGGIKSYFSHLMYDGRRYPSNPTVNPKVSGAINGVVILSDDISVNKGIKF